MKQKSKSVERNEQRERNQIRQQVFDLKDISVLRKVREVIDAHADKPNNAHSK